MRSSVSLESSAQGLDRLRFVAVCIEHGQQLSHLQEVLRLLVEVEQLRVTSAIPDGCVDGNELSKSSAVDVRNATQIQHELEGSIFDKPADCGTKKQYSFADRESAGHVEDDHFTRLPGVESKCH